jgi:hypothetical protein
MYPADDLLLVLLLGQDLQNQMLDYSMGCICEILRCTCCPFPAFRDKNIESRAECQLGYRKYWVICDVM